MHTPKASVLRSLYTSNRSSIFRHHARIANSIFARPCSCTATLSEQAPTPTPQLNTVAHDPPVPAADHRELAIAQGIFTTSQYSPGSPLLLPNGSDMFIKLTNLLRGLYPQFGLREVITPTIYKKSLWEKSGHWENYAEDMFEVRGRGASGRKEGAEIGEDEEYGLKPMNCPGHCLLFASEQRSYRDLPVRFADFSPLHRNEISGALSGLTRVRRFHQDDAHIFCRPGQIEDEIRKTMSFIELIYSKIFDFGPYRLVLSTRPKENYIGTLEEWDAAENQLKMALDSTGREWSLNEGDGAFYGPKIDIILRDSDGKEHQTATIQLDFQLPQRFGLEYKVGDAGKEAVAESSSEPIKETSITAGFAPPIMIHRAILGSLERFLALLIEHYNGCYPYWISPRPAIVLTTSADHSLEDYAKHISERLGQGPHDFGLQASLKQDLALLEARELITIHADHDFANRSISKKTRLARKEGYNFILIVGPKEVAAGTVTVQMWNQRRPEIAAKLLMLGQVGSDADEEKALKGLQVAMQVDDAVKFFRKLWSHYL